MQFSGQENSIKSFIGEECNEENKSQKILSCKRERVTDRGLLSKYWLSD
jgi:hypothetical protein